MLTGRRSQIRHVAIAAITALALALAAFALFRIPLAHAQPISSNEILLEEVGTELGTSTEDIRIIIARIIRVIFGVLGIVAVVLIMYAGYLWMTAKGEPDQIDRAKKTMSGAVIGLVIMLSAFAFVSFVIGQLIAAGQGGVGAGGSGGSTSAQDRACIGLSATCPAGALGNGFVESHYPSRNATGVPRNTRIVVTFKEPVQPESVVVGGATSTVAILKSVDVVNSNQFLQKFTRSLDADDVQVFPSADMRTFTFIQRNCPSECFGSPSENVFYTVAFRGGGDGIRKADGQAAFSGTFNNGYAWEFQVSTILDVTPPKVAFAAPSDGEAGIPRNSLVQMTFSEAVDPVSLTNGFSVSRAAGPIAGATLFGNGYKTVEFRTDELCGTNSCGETVYCLPGASAITATARAAALTANPPAAVFPPNGVTDMAGNSLDGDGDGAAEGPSDDDHAVRFSTNNAIDLTPPRVVAQEPAALQGSIARDLRMSVTFSKIMSVTSFTTEAIRLVPGPNGAPTNYWTGAEAVSSQVGGDPDQTRALIQHDLLSVNQPYAADLASTLKDLRQNCFLPAGGTAVCTGDEPYCCNGVPSDVQCGFLN